MAVNEKGEPGGMYKYSCAHRTDTMHNQSVDRLFIEIAHHITGTDERNGWHSMCTHCANVHYEYAASATWPVRPNGIYLINKNWHIRILPFRFLTCSSSVQFFSLSLRMCHVRNAGFVTNEPNLYGCTQFNVHQAADSTHKTNAEY